MTTSPPSPTPLGRRRILYIAGGVAAGLIVVVFVIIAVVRGSSSSSSSANLDPTATTTPEQGSTQPGNSATSTAPKGTSTTRPGGTHASTPGGASTPTTSTAGGTSPETSSGGPPQTGPKTPDTTPPAIDQAYQQAYIGECKSIWSNADSNGVLIDIDDPAKRPFLVSDCTSLMDTDDGEYLIDTVADARSQGQQDAYWNLDDVMVGRRLRNTSGTKTWVSPLSINGGQPP